MLSDQLDFVALVRRLLHDLSDEVDAFGKPLELRCGDDDFVFVKAVVKAIGDPLDRQQEAAGVDRPVPLERPQQGQDHPVGQQRRFQHCHLSPVRHDGPDDARHAGELLRCPLLHRLCVLRPQPVGRGHVFYIQESYEPGRIRFAARDGV